jgi:oxygen-independent coproporphyrinogen-3 oxidase
LSRPPVALYIHFPFCLSLCPYCDFVVYAGKNARGPNSRVAALVDALVKEISLRAATARSPLGSVYFGGGTPSLLHPAQVGRLLAAADSAFGVATAAEVTLEANPGPGERGDMPGFRAAGVNRLSIGAQSFIPAELRRLGRRHSPADVAETVAEAQRANIANVSLDLLYDVPGQTLESWSVSLHAAIALGPDHVSAYSLSLDDPDDEGLTPEVGDHLPLRPGARRWRARARREQDADRAAEMYLLADEILGKAGHEWYEISNWAYPGSESRHNLVYWRGDAWEAVGPGAHAFDGHRTRRWNAAHLGRYMDALARDEMPPGQDLVSDLAAAASDRAILHLRTRDGLQPRSCSNPAFVPAIAWGRAWGLLEPKPDGGVRLTRRGRLLSNELFVRLLPVQAESAA